MNVNFSENDIRPDVLKEAQLGAIEHDVDWLISRKDQFIHVKCPACGADSPRPAFTKTNLDYVTCGFCEILYINPRPTAEMLGAFYAQSENYAYWNKYIFPASEEARRKKIFRPRAERVAEYCRQYCPEARSLLEIGAGFGTFGEEISKLNVFDKISVVEPTPDLAATCRGRGLDVIEKPFELLDNKDASVDVIASFECVEHLFDPRSFFERCGKLLRVGGLLFVTCPSCRGFDIQVLQDKADIVDHEHLNYFHPEALRSLMESCGFCVVAVETPGKLDAELVRKKVLDGQISLKGNPFLEEVLIRQWHDLGSRFQKFLSENTLSSHMWVVATRK